MSAKEKTTGFLAEFRKFIARGNVMDLAVGVIIGGAFKGITDSLVNDILNPVLGIFAGDNEALAGLSIPLPGGGDLMLGSFLNAVLSFLIMAFVVFCIVKLLNRLHKKEESVLQRAKQLCPWPFTMRFFMRWPKKRALHLLTTRKQL